MNLELDKPERDLIIAAMNDFDGELPFALVGLRVNLNDNLVELTMEKAQALYRFLENEISDLGSIDFTEEVEQIELILEKIKPLLKD